MTVHIVAALRHEFLSVAPSDHGAAIRVVGTLDKSRLEIRGVDGAAGRPGVVGIHIENHVSDVYYSLGSGRDRLAHVIAVGSSAGSALDRAAAAANAAEFVRSGVPGQVEYV